VDALAGIHKAISGGGVGRPKQDLEVLNRSMLILAVGMWEAYFEDVVRDASEFMVKAARKPDDLPESLRRKVACQVRDIIRTDSEVLRVYELCGDGYKAKCREWIGRALEQFNTPDCEGVEQMLLDVLGMRVDLKKVTWQGMKSAGDRLDEVLQRRHEIAHKGRANAAQWKMTVSNDRTFLESLAKQLDRMIADYVEKRCGKRPWQ
jgi:hypothetical protein